MSSKWVLLSILLEAVLVVPAVAQPTKITSIYLDAYVVSDSSAESCLVVKPENVFQRTQPLGVSSFPNGIIVDDRTGVVLFKVNSLTPKVRVLDLLKQDQYNHVVASFSDFNDEDLLFVCQKQRKVEVLEISNTDVTHSLADACRTWDLLGLDVSGLSVDDMLVNAIRDCESLQFLGLARTKTNEVELAKCLKNVNELRFLFLNQGDRGRDTWKEVASMKWLNTLDASNTDISDDDIKLILKLPMLRRLYLHHSRITENGLEMLVAPNSLESFSVSIPKGLDKDTRRMIEGDKRAIIVR